MRIPKATFRKSGVVALLGVVSLLMTSVGPAAAQEAAGAGAGTGWEYPGGFGECPFVPPTPEPPEPGGLPLPTVTTPSGFPAAHLANDRFELSHYGTYDAVGTPTTGQPVPNIAAYLGGTDVTIMVGPHFISPLGTHTDHTPAVGDDCPNLSGAANVIPGPVPITDVDIVGMADLPGPNPDFPPDPPPTGLITGSVNCEFNPSEDTGYYIRVSSAVLFTFTVTCTITGNVAELGTGTVEVHNVRHFIEGTMNPCLLAPPVDLATNPECEFFEDPEAGGAGSHLVTAYEAVAPDVPEAAVDALEDILLTLP